MPYAVAVPYAGRLRRIVEIHPSQEEAFEAAKQFTPAPPGGEVYIYLVVEGTKVGALVPAQSLGSVKR